mgnify:CR=1 FL=1
MAHSDFTHAVKGQTFVPLGALFRTTKTKNMALKITDECINCGACEPECPNNAIYEGSAQWAISDKTSVSGSFVMMDGTVVDVNQRFPALAEDTYYIVPNKCTECQGFHEEPQCASVCPVDCCVPDEAYQETVDQLMAKKEALHP